jgi:signal transduction histidine kinase
VEKHGGKIDVSSKEGRGTTFSLTFPATRRGANRSVPIK